MSQLIELLSGSIPGGIVLLSLALLFGNLTVYFLHSSGMLIVSIRKKYIFVNLFFVFIYALIWSYTLPEAPPERMVVLPTQSTPSSALNSTSLALADYLQQKPGDVRAKFIVHRWEWIFETLGTDSVSRYANWERLAYKLKPTYLIESKRDDEQVTLTIYAKEESVPVIKVFSAQDFPENTFNFIQEKLKIFSKPSFQLPNENTKWLEGKLALEHHKYDQVFNILGADTSGTARLIVASAWVAKGLTFKIDRIKRQYVKMVNPDFEKAKSILNQLVKERRDIPGVAFLLGRIAIRDEQFSDAEVFLKKALVDDPKNARTYYLLGYLLNERLEELGFDNRMEIVEKAIQLDPGYAQAVYDLANTYFTSGTGLEHGSATLAARKTLTRFLKLQHNDPRILSMLGTINMKIQKYAEAKRIFEELNNRFPDDSNSYYNLGILSFAQQKYDSALTYFKTAVKMDGNKDAMLYAGLTEERLGNNEKALAYYRRRVRLSTSEDDKYAKEAMKGIRHVLRIMKKDVKKDTKVK